jgi:hypothetical protein
MQKTLCKWLWLAITLYGLCILKIDYQDYVPDNYVLHLWSFVIWHYALSFNNQNPRITNSTLSLDIHAFVRSFYKILIVRGIDCVWLLVVLHCASRSVYIEYKSLEGQATSEYIWQPTIHNIYPTKYIPTYMIVYYTEYIVYQIYSNT